MANHPNRSRAKSQPSNLAEKKENRGGKRAGSGRKMSDSKKKMISTRLAVDVVEYLDSRDDKPKSQLIEEALRDHKSNYLK